MISGMAMNSPWMDLILAAKYCQLSTRTLRRAVDSGHLRCSRITGKLMFRISWLDRYMMFGKIRLKPTEKKEMKNLL
jgi:hypothetical protein